jgi:C-terminal processing protease CtpA/Prc
MSVRPKDPMTGQLMGNHAVLVIRGDTSGKISIANWGKFSHGRLVQKKDGQWFIPDDRSQHELRINALTTLIPFVPKA